MTPMLGDSCTPTIDYPPVPERSAPPKRQVPIRMASARAALDRPARPVVKRQKAWIPINPHPTTWPSQEGEEDV